MLQHMTLKESMNVQDTVQIQDLYEVYPGKV